MNIKNLLLFSGTGLIAAAIIIKGDTGDWLTLAGFPMIIVSMLMDWMDRSKPPE